MFIIAGLYRRRRLTVPKGGLTRPTANRLREALFNICQNKIADARFLDVYAGSGAMGFEALSRGACSATFVDSSQEAISCIKANAAHLQVEHQTKIFRGDAFAMLDRLNRLEERFDIIYVDPPYRTVSSKSGILLSREIVQWVDAHSILNPSGSLFVEEDFQCQPHTEDLETLSFLGSRRFGQAGLSHYRLVEARAKS